MSEVVILVVAVGFAGMGLLAVLKPLEVVAQFGVKDDSPEYRNEIRAVYGGFGIAVAALLAIAALGDPDTAEGIVIAVAISLLGMAAGRIVSALIDPPRGFHPVWTYFAIEVASGVALLLVA